MLASQLPPAGEKDLRRKLIQTGVSLSLLLVSGIIFVVLRIAKGNIGGGLLWAFACLVIGGIGGFLFAIPRVSRSDTDTDLHGSKSRFSTQPSQPYSREEEPDVNVEQKTITLLKHAERGLGLGINTNLEDISDWLTKMIVGIGLVELRSVPEHMARLGDYIGRGLGEGMQTTASSIVIYFTGLGLLSSYLLTRMFVGPAFLLADQATHSGVAYDTAQTALALAEMEGEVSGAFDILKRKELQTPSRLDYLINELSRFRVQFPLNRRLHITLGRLYRYKKDYDSAIRVLTEFARRKRIAKQVDLDLSDALFNIACYYSLKLEGQADEPARQSLVKRALKVIKESIEICPENIDDVKEDPDLKALWETDLGGKVLQDSDFTGI